MRSEDQKARDSASRRRFEKTPKARFSYGKRLAKYRGITWELTFEQYQNLVHTHCFYCNGLLNKTGIGLDRMNNDKGYTEFNVLPCCGRCNQLKSNLLTPKETIELVELLKTLRGGRAWI